MARNLVRRGELPSKHLGVPNGVNGTGSHGPEGERPSLRYETPRMPVVFVLGGPGSGKITHSETLVRHRKGYVHVNMTEKMHKLLEGTGG